MGVVESRRKIAWETRNGIGYLNFVDPPENRMDTLFFQELQKLTSTIIPQSNIQALIISGSSRHFSSGANLDELFLAITKEKAESDILLSNYRSLQTLSELNVPVIAAIKGVCLGSALELALHCHFRICSEDGILGLPETSFGLIPGLGGIPKLKHVSGTAKTMELVLKGNTFNASDALAWNIVDAVYPKKLVITKAEQLAKLATADYRKYKKRDYLIALDKVSSY